MFVSTILAYLLYLIMPSFFLSLSNPETRKLIDRSLYVNRLLPIALTFSASMVLSNQAYFYLSVAFLQMMKETNMVLVYTFSLLAGLEMFTWNHMKIIVVILFASFMTVEGELDFSMVGFLVQGAGLLCECTKVVLQGFLLSSAGMKLDAPSFVLLVSPLCLVALIAVMGAIQVLGPYIAWGLELPSMGELYAWWPVLLLNGTLAFTLNVIVACFIKHTSAVAMVMVSIVKDVTIVSTGVFLFHEQISTQQTVGFVLQLTMIWVWSLMKMFPREFNDGVLNGVANMVNKVVGMLTGTALKEEKLILNEGKDTKDYGAAAGKEQEQIPEPNPLPEKYEKGAQ